MTTIEVTTIERANRIVDQLRTRSWCGPAERAEVVTVIGDLVRDLANAEQRCIALEYQLAALRASVVDAMSSAGPEVAEDERAG